MKNIFSILCILLAAFSNAIAHADSMDNVLPVTITNANKLLVTITVCLPGATGDTNCKTIPNVLLDAGSDGLKLFASVVPSGLPKIANSAGENLGLCGTFGKGGTVWGPFVTADLVLGADRATNVPVQIVDATFSKIPADCQNPVTDASSLLGGVNGVLGIGAGAQLPGAQLPPGNGLYVCKDGNCEICSVLTPASCGTGFPGIPSDINPIQFVAGDNNGWVLQLPAPASTGSASLGGTLTLGLGTRANNVAPKNIQIFPVDANGLIPVQFQGKNYSAVLDTGAGAWVFPTALTDVALCLGNASAFYCPNNPVQLQATLVNSISSPTAQAKVDISLVDIHGLTQSGAFNDIGTAPAMVNGAYQGIFIMGLPFFMGRTVYYGLKGASTPLGVGPFDAL